MPNCSVMLFRQGERVGDEIIASFDDDFCQTITNVVAQAKLKIEPNMVIVWLGSRAFGFWYMGPFRVKPMCFKLLTKLGHSETGLVWPKGCVVAGIPAFNQPDWFTDQKFYIDHPYRSIPYNYSKMFGVVYEPETILIDANAFSSGLVEDVPIY